MRHLHLGKYYPPDRGGMETVLREQCHGLATAGHTVWALVAGRRDEELVTGPGGRIRVLRCRRAAVVASQPLVPGLTALLRRAWRELRPEAVTLHWPNPLAAALLLATWREAPPGARLFVWYHADVTRQRLLRPLLRPLLRGLWRRVAGIAVSSRTLKERSPVLAPVRDRVRVIPFGIDPEPWLAAAERSSGPDPGFLFVGRLVYYKGIEVLLEAIARLPQARLTVVGDGPLAGRLRRRAARPDLASRVVWRGEIPARELQELLPRARALVLPSVAESETFGLVQLEAMAAGVPVVATRLPTGAGEIVRDGRTGLLVPPGDPDALAAALGQLLSRPELARRWGEEGRRLLLSRYTRERMVERLELWYRQPEAVSPAGEE